MATAFITVTQGRREGDFSGPDGSYNVILTDVSEAVTEVAKGGPNAGEEYTYRTWTFAIEDGEFEGQIIDARTSNASGPKSKMYGFLTALFGGKAPPPGTQLEKSQIVGRSAIAMIGSNDGGYPIITGLAAAPRASAPKPAPKPEPVAASDDLPF